MVPHAALKMIVFLATMAVAINAQCAVTCSLQAAAQSAHACCKHHKAPVEKSKKCLEAAPAVADVQKAGAPLYVADVLQMSAQPTLPLRFGRQATVLALPGSPPAPALLILRI